MKIFHSVASALILVLAAIQTTAAAPRPAAPKNTTGSYVKVLVAAANSTIRDGIEQNTSLEAVRRVVLYPKVTGRLESLKVKKGTPVKLNQVLAVLGHSEQDAQLASARAQILSAQAAEERTKAEMDNARITLQRYQRLKKEGFSTQQELETKDTSYRSAKALYDAARANKSQLSADYSRISSTLKEYIITAPINGTVLNDYSLTPGAMLSTSTPVLELADLTHLKAILKLPETRLYSIKPGMEVSLKLDALPQEEFHGKITIIDSYVDPNTRTANVELALDNAAVGNKLRPGMFGRGFIVLKESKNAIVIPSSVLQKLNKQTGVMLVENGKAKFVPVKTGIQQGINIELISGVKPGDKIITFGGNNLKEGDTVIITE